MNNVLHHWYPLAVDYQAKRLQKVGNDLSLRYLKFLHRLKLASAGMLSSFPHSTPFIPYTGICQLTADLDPTINFSKVQDDN
jgi:hypothetical protein